MTETLAFSDDPRTQERLEPSFAPEAQAAAWRTEPHPYTRRWTADDFQEVQAAFPTTLELIRLLHERGVLLTTGSDLGNPWITPGVSLHREIWLLHQAGIPALEVLTIATRNGAEALGILDEVGTVETGKRADLVILDADPLDDIQNTRAIEAVYVGGDRITRGTERQF